ncbi:hypothetical protein BDA96_08G085700 [Sorghum bicolor]|uniref:Uncharacterized protein n=2 Tax=Sorghum bicolor TaxID=4558 RepID=A0A921U6Y1_SORBI|nr:hypothetical protein BDA96_08G085700 [Sorghum bicolor]OQU78970.1 hypothetical protein SORBI_3008G079766 [Sorghum bicolor]
MLMHRRYFSLLVEQTYQCHLRLTFVANHVRCSLPTCRKCRPYLVAMAMLVLLESMKKPSSFAACRVL